MELPVSSGQTFILKLMGIIRDNLSDEHFGVSELAKNAGVSRSYLHRKLKSATNKPAARFIREVRLHEANHLLLSGNLTASEVAFKTGFNSPAYFNNCFHAYYGYTPGDARKRMDLSTLHNQFHPVQSIVIGTGHVTLKKTQIHFSRKSWRTIAALVVLVLLFFLIFANLFSGSKNNLNNREIEKSIIVFPFKNFSADAENQHLCNSISEDIRNHLSRIEGLTVVSHSSAVQFRESALPAQEIARQMQVIYVLEGSVRRHENNIRVVVQLIDARNDRHLWSEAYDRQLPDILTLQSDIAINVTEKLHSVFTPSANRK